jgi:hypothetical protein
MGTLQDKGMGKGTDMELLGKVPGLLLHLELSLVNYPPLNTLMGRLKWGFLGTRYYY